MELLWLLLIVVLALALFGGIGFRNGGFGRRIGVLAVTGTLAGASDSVAGSSAWSSSSRS